MGRAIACIVLLLLASPFARAQSYGSDCTSSLTTANCVDEGLAHMWASKRPRDFIASSTTDQWTTLSPPGYSAQFQCTVNGVLSQCKTVTYEARSATGSGTASQNRSWPIAASCSTRPEQDEWLPPEGTPNTDVCSDGCTYTQVLDESASHGFFYAPSGGVCTVNQQPVIDTDGDGVPNELDAFPNDPNESADTDGDGIGDNADFSPDDPTDGKDTPGEEDGDDEGDNEASGGGTCDAPPSCSGDGIQCAQLFQQWKMVCKGATVTGSPEVCNASYTCTGDSAQCAQIALARKSACATGNPSGGSGDANGNGQPDWTEGSEPARDDPGADDDVNDLGIGLSTDMLDTENIFGMGSCQDFSITVMGTVVSTADLDGLWCSRIAPIMRAVILIMAAFFAIRLLLGGV